MKHVRMRLFAIMAILFLACSLLLSQEQDKPAGPGNKVNGFEIYLDRDGEVQSGPAVEVDGRERYVTIRARSSKWLTRDKEVVEDVKLEQVQWAVVTVGAIPVKTSEDFDAVNSSLIVGLPDDGEGLLVYACALVAVGDKKVMTRHALLSVRVAGKRPPVGKAGPAAGPAPLETPVAVPANVTGLSVVLASRDAPSKELTDLVGSPRIKEELARSKSAIYLYGPEQLAKRPDVVAVLKDSTGKDLAQGLVVITGDGKAVLPAGKAIRLVYLRYDGKTDKDSLARNEVILLDTIGRAAGGK